MKTKANMWIAALTLTAIVMVVVLLAAPQRQAQAEMLNAQTGYSLITTGTGGGDEVLIIVDKSTQRMVVYKLNGNTLDALAGIDFGRLFTR